MSDRIDVTLFIGGTSSCDSALFELFQLYHIGGIEKLVGEVWVGGAESDSKSGSSGSFGAKTMRSLHRSLVVIDSDGEGEGARDMGAERVCKLRKEEDRDGGWM